MGTALFNSEQALLNRLSNIPGVQYLGEVLDNWEITSDKCPGVGYQWIGGENLVLVSPPNVGVMESLVSVKWIEDAKYNEYCTIATIAPCSIADGDTVTLNINSQVVVSKAFPTGGTATDFINLITGSVGNGYTAYVDPSTNNILVVPTTQNTIFTLSMDAPYSSQVINVEISRGGRWLRDQVLNAIMGGYDTQNPSYQGGDLGAGNSWWKPPVIVTRKYSCHAPAGFIAGSMTIRITSNWFEAGKL